MEISAGFSVPSSLGPFNAELNAQVSIDREGGNDQSIGADFESVFMSMLVKEMRKAAGPDLFAGDKSDALGGMFDMHIGKQIADTGGLGIGQLVENWLAMRDESE